MIEFITGVLFILTTITTVLTIRLQKNIIYLENQVNDLKSSIKEICRDINMVEHTLSNQINYIDQTHTQTENELRQVISGSMKSSNKRLLKG